MYRAICCFVFFRRKNCFMCCTIFISINCTRGKHIAFKSKKLVVQVEVTKQSRGYAIKLLYDPERHHKKQLFTSLQSSRLRFYTWRFLKLKLQEQTMLNKNQPDAH
jgi:hypothetical protein